MDSPFSELNKPVLHALKELLLAKKKSGSHKIVVFAGAAVSIHAPSNLPSAYSMLEATIQLLLQDSKLSKALSKAALSQRLSNLILESSGSQDRFVPPELIYDSIYEFAGKKVFNALDCLNSHRPNLNHKLLAALLQNGFIDHIITTNFDTLIEQSLKTAQTPLSTLSGERVWKIHGDIRTPSSMATTMRRIGQAAFDEKLVKKLKDLLEGSHVLFIGYSGMDPDLMPAFKTATMESVYWCVRWPKEVNAKEQNPIINRDPCKTIIEKKTQIRWIIGDLQEELLVPIAKELLNEDTNSLISLNSSDRDDPVSPLQKSINKWERSFFRRLSPSEKARSVLQIIYYIGLYSPKPYRAWILLIETAEAMGRDQVLAKYHSSEFKRDLQAFQAEAYLKLGELVRQLNDTVVSEAFRDPDFLRDLSLYKRAELIRHSEAERLLSEVMRALQRAPLKIESLNTAKHIEQLYTRAKDHLTPILPLAFRDAVQIQALLNASTILYGLASKKNETNWLKNIQGAQQMLERGITISDRAKMSPDQKNILKARCYSNLAVLYIEQSNFQDGLKLFERAERLFEKVGDLYSYAATCINMGVLLMNLYKTYRLQIYKDEAQKYCQDARARLNSFPNKMLSDNAEKLNNTLERTF